MQTGYQRPEAIDHPPSSGFGTGGCGFRGAGASAP
jgi:hypothetical protein